MNERRGHPCMVRARFPRRGRIAMHTMASADGFAGQSRRADFRTRDAPGGGDYARISREKTPWAVPASRRVNGVYAAACVPTQTAPVPQRKPTDSARALALVPPIRRPWRRQPSLRDSYERRMAAPTPCDRRRRATVRTKRQEPAAPRRRRLRREAVRVTRSTRPSAPVTSARVKCGLLEMPPRGVPPARRAKRRRGPPARDDLGRRARRLRRR